MSKTKLFKILIIDDDQQIVDLIQMFLSMNIPDLFCVTANDAQTAALKLSNQEFDLIILDFKMPGKNGLELTTQIKKVPKFNKIPIILMSGALMQQDAIAAIEGGVRDILVKPFTMKQLIDKISPFINQFKRG